MGRGMGDCEASPPRRGAGGALERGQNKDIEEKAIE